ncbi:376_t:CDS:2, partial [Funneliformis geosporum]
DVSYMHLQNKALDESLWVPLLPGYVVYTSLVGNFFNFFWQDFGKDFMFTNLLGLNESNIIEILQKAVHEVFSNRSIICEIRLEECGKNIVPKSVQALMIAHKENKLALYNANHNVKHHCHNINIQNKTYHTSCAGFKITIDVDCQMYRTIDSFSNQSERVNFSHFIVAATLAGDLNRHAI